MVVGLACGITGFLSLAACIGSSMELLLSGTSIGTRGHLVSYAAAFNWRSNRLNDLFGISCSQLYRLPEFAAKQCNSKQYELMLLEESSSGFRPSAKL